MGEIIKVYKGTDKDMKCRGMQYNLGETVKSDDAILCGSKGFHSCEAPLDVLQYYSAKDGNRFFEAEAGGKIDRTGADDSKIASSELTLKAEIGLPGLVKAQIEYVKKHCTNERNAKPGKPATAGSYGAATAGYRGAATAGYRGAATAGDSGAATSRGSVTVGENGVGTVRGNDVKIRGGMGALLVCAIENYDNYDIAEWKAVVVDGEQIKAYTWYTLKNGEVVEAE